MKHDPAPTRRKKGRPLSFDRDEALHLAMLAFWRTGYETTSISDLTRAMGITAPSLYGAFGDKRRLFLEAVALYRGDPAAEAAMIAEAATSRDAAEMMLSGAIARFTGAETPTGCLLASSVATGSDAAAEERTAVAAIRAEIETRLRERIARDVDEGVLPRNTDADTLARTVICTVQGMSTLARDGADAEQLRRVAEQTMRGWPAN